jgi:hypothetical protein
VRYRYGGTARELTIGRYPGIGLAKARELATEARAKIQQGADVARDKQKANIERAAAKSLRQLATDYMAKKFPDFAANTVKQRRHHIDDIIIPKLGGLAARDVTTSDVVALVEAVGQRSPTELWNALAANVPDAVHKNRAWTSVIKLKERLRRFQPVFRWQGIELDLERRTNDPQRKRLYTIRRTCRDSTRVRD